MVLAKWGAYEAGRRIFRFSLAFAARQKLLGLGAASFRADGAAATKYLQLICDGSKSLTNGIISVRGLHHGTHMREPLEDTINLKVPTLAHIKTPFGRWMEEAFHAELPRIEHFRPFLEYAAGRFVIKVVAGTAGVVTIFFL